MNIKIKKLINLKKINNKDFCKTINNMIEYFK